MVEHLQASTFSLEWCDRRIESSGQTRRRFLDFQIDGKSLLDIPGTTLITPLGWLGSDTTQQVVAELLLKRPSGALQTGRVELYVCPECADIYCGSVTVKIEKMGSYFVWRDFAFENDLDSGPLAYEKMANWKLIGPFHFEKSQYWRVLNGV